LRTRSNTNIPTAVRELLKILDSDYFSGKHFSIGESCRKLGYTPEALIRLFKQYNGITPGRYLRNRRLTKACRLLSGSRLGIKQIAYECGFESQNYLGRIFKQVLGITPKQYRNNPDLLLLEKLDMNILQD
jgi:AraC-like DNA-binding protein